MIAHQKEKEKEKRKTERLKKSVSVSALSKKADVLWSKAVKTKYDHKCAYCGKTENLNSHHIFGRNNKSVRWEIGNGICLCAGHHTFSSEFSAHKTPTEFTYWIENEYGREWLHALQQLAHEPLKVTPEYLQDRIEFFSTYVREIEGK